VSKPLYEIDHPYYGADGHVEEFEHLDDLISAVNAYDEDWNHVYRWDWLIPDGEEWADLVLYVVLQRKSQFLQWSAPASRLDEPKVREFLSSDRIAGALRRMWEPILDAYPDPSRWWRAVAPDGSLWAESSSESEIRARMRPGDKLQRSYVNLGGEWRDVQ
jgi:hypothetical protein